METILCPNKFPLFHKTFYVEKNSEFLFDKKNNNSSN